jgi:hypothetical protein
VHQLQWSSAAVVPDSYAGVFPEGAIGPLLYKYNFCSAGFVSEALREKCLDKQLTNMDVVSEYLANSPEVPLAYIQVEHLSRCSCLLLSLAHRTHLITLSSNACIHTSSQSKTDTVQMSFYVSLGLTTPNTTAAITPAEFYADVNDIFEVAAPSPHSMLARFLAAFTARDELTPT